MLSFLDVSAIVSWFRAPFVLMQKFTFFQYTLPGGEVITVDMLDCFIYLCIVSVVISVFLKGGDWKHE